MSALGAPTHGHSWEEPFPWPHFSIGFWCLGGFLIELVLISFRCFYITFSSMLSHRFSIHFSIYFDILVNENTVRTLTMLNLVTFTMDLHVFTLQKNMMLLDDHNFPDTSFGICFMHSCTDVSFRLGAFWHTLSCFSRHMFVVCFFCWLWFEPQWLPIRILDAPF